MIEVAGLWQRLSHHCSFAQAGTSLRLREAGWQRTAGGPSAEQVPESQNRMSVNHPRAGISHHLPDPVAHILPVTMDPAVRTGGLVRCIRALPDFQRHILQQFVAVPARLVVMKPPAEHFDHDTGGFDLQIFPTAHLMYAALNFSSK